MRMPTKMPTALLASAGYYWNSSEQCQVRLAVLRLVSNLRAFSFSEFVALDDLLATYLRASHKRAGSSKRYFAPLTRCPAPFSLLIPFCNK